MADNNPKQPNQPPPVYTPQQLATMEEARQSMQDMRDFSQSMLRSFKELNGIVNRTNNTFGTSADFAKEILSNVKARGVIESAISDNIRASENKILELQLAKYDATQKKRMEEEFLAGMQADIAAQIEKKQADINQLQSEENDLVKQHIEMTDKMVALQDNILGIEKELEATVLKKANAENAIAKAKQGILSVDGAILANQNAIVENAQKKQSIDAKLFALEERMNEAQLKSIHDGIDLSAEYNSMIKQREFLQKRQADLENTNTKYIADGLKLQERRGRIEHTLLNAQDDFNEALAKSTSLEENLRKKNIEQGELAADMSSVWNQVLDKQAQRNVLEKELAELIKKQAILKDQGLSPSFLDELIERQRKLIEENRKAAIEYKLQAGYLAHMEDNQYAMLGPAAGLVKSYKEFSETVKTIPIQFMLLDKLISLAIDRFIALDAAAENFRKATGFTSTQMISLRKTVEEVNRENAGLGVKIENAYKAAQALTDVFGRTSLVTKEAVENIALMNVNLGVAEADSAEVLAIFQGLGGATEQVAMNTMMAGAALSEKTGVPFSKVMNDIAKSSGTTAMLLGTNPSKLMKAAIAARALGTDLNKLAAQQEKLLNYTDSINSELEASALLGRSISFQRARQLAYEGKVEESAKATLDMVKQAGDFNEMNIYQRKALAAAAGMELGDLTKMMAAEQRRNEIRMKGTPEQQKQLEMQEAELKKLRETNDLTKDNVLEENKKAIAQAKIQGLMTQINNLLDQMKTTFADLLEPVITPLVKVLIPAFKILAFVAKLITPVIKGMVYPIQLAAEYIAKWTDGIDIALNASKGFKDFFDNTIVKWALGLGGVFTLLFFGRGGIGKLMSAVSGPFKLVRNLGSNLIDAVKKPFMAKALEAPKTPDLTKTADTTKKLTESAKGTERVPSGSGVKEFLTNLAAGLKEMGNGKVLFGAVNLIPSSIGLIAMIPGLVGAKLMERLNGKALREAMEGLANGLKEMGSSKVLFGAVNLIPAAIGLTAMVGGFLGAKLIEKIEGKKVLQGMEGLADGIKKMASADVLLGAGALVVASLGLIAMIPGFIGAKLIERIDSKAIMAGMTGLAVGLTSMASPAVLLGSLALIGASAALTLMIPGLIGMAGIALLGTPFSAGLIAVSVGLSALGGNPAVWLGIAAMGALSLSFIGFGFAAKLASEAFMNIATAIPESIVPLTQLALISPLLYVAAGGIGALAVSFGLLAASSLSAGIASIAILVVSKSVDSLGKSFEYVAKGTQAMVRSIPAVINPIRQFASINMKEAAQGLMQLSAALGSFGIGSAVAGIGSFIGNFLGGDPIEKMERLASISDKLKVSAESISAIAIATSRFSTVDSFAKSVGVLADSLNKLSDSLGKIKTEELAKLTTIGNAATPKTETQPTATTTTDMAGVEAKLDKLTELLVGGAVRVYLDGKNVSAAMANTSGR